MLSLFRVTCIAAVTFDLEAGQDIEVMLPAQHHFPKSFTDNIKHLAFPDNNSGSKTPWRVFVCVRVRACVRVRVCVCVCASACVCLHVFRLLVKKATVVHPQLPVFTNANQHNNTHLRACVQACRVHRASL